MRVWLLVFLLAGCVAPEPEPVAPTVVHRAIVEAERYASASCEPSIDYRAWASEGLVVVFEGACSVVWKVSRNGTLDGFVAEGNGTITIEGAKHPVPADHARVAFDGPVVSRSFVAHLNGSIILDFWTLLPSKQASNATAEHGAHEGTPGGQIAPAGPLSIEAEDGHGGCATQWGESWGIVMRMPDGCSLVIEDVRLPTAGRFRGVEGLVVGGDSAEAHVEVTIDGELVATGVARGGPTLHAFTETVDVEAGTVDVGLHIRMVRGARLDVDRVEFA